MHGTERITEPCPLVAVVIAATLIVIRVLWVFPLWAGSQWRQAPPPVLDGADRGVLGWDRGAMPLAAALSIPLIVQGLTLEPLVRRTAVAQPAASTQQEETAARLRLAEAGITRLDELAASEDVPDVEIDRMRRALNVRVRQARARLHQAGDDAQGGRSGRDIHRDVIAAENAELASLYAAGTISAATRLGLQHGLDLELARLGNERTDRRVVPRGLLLLPLLALVRVRSSIVAGVPGSLVGDVHDLAARRLGGTHMVPGISRLIVGASGSPGSLRALRYGEFLARAHHAVLMPVMAWEPPGGERAERIQPSGPLREESRNLACQRLQDALIAVWGEIPDDPMVEPHIERGPAGWVLVSLACQPADVLLVGAGRRSAVSWRRSSTVTRYCLAHAKCPVLAVPPPELARELGHGRLARMLRHRPLTAEQVLGDQPSPPS